MNKQDNCLIVLGVSSNWMLNLAIFNQDSGEDLFAVILLALAVGIYTIFALIALFTD